MPDAGQDAKPGQRGMGRGLAAILPRSRADESGLREIPLDLVTPNPRQPRRDFDEEALLALAESIRSRGILQPVVVRPVAGGTYELVAGERRLRAARLAELERIPAVVREADDWERLDLALAENMARVDLNAVEEARACAMLVEDLGLTKGEVGRRVGKSRVAVSNLIRLLELPDEVPRADRIGQHSAKATAARSCCARTTTPASAWPATPATRAGRSARPNAARRASRKASRAARPNPARSIPTWPTPWERPRTLSRQHWAKR